MTILKKIRDFMTYIIISHVIWWTVTYFVYTWLAGYSLAYAYVWNLFMIFLAVAIDEYSHRIFQSEKHIAQLKQEQEKGLLTQKHYRYLEFQLGHFISFKTVLYVLYIFILILSQMSASNPDLLTGNFGAFIRANDYSVLLLLAVDEVMNQIAKDRASKRKSLEALRETFPEYQE